MVIMVGVEESGLSGRGGAGRGVDVIFWGSDGGGLMAVIRGSGLFIWNDGGDGTMDASLGDNSSRH